MDKDFGFGLVLGLLGGAVLVANSYKARKLVRDGQEQIKNKVKEMSDKCNESEDYSQLDE